MKRYKPLLAFALALSLFSVEGVHASSISPEAAYAAQWLPNAVKITFDSNGGGVAPGEQIYTYGIERSLPNICAMQKEGYTFQGWASSATATTPDWLPGATSTTAFGYANANEAVAKTLYAVWKQDTTTATLTDTLNSISTFLGLLSKSTTPTAANYDNASLVEKVNFIESELATVKSDVATNKTNITTIKSDVATNKTNINTANTNINSIKSTVSSLGSSGGGLKLQFGGQGTFSRTATSNDTSAQVVGSINNTYGGIVYCYPFMGSSGASRSAFSASVGSKNQCELYIDNQQCTKPWTLVCTYDSNNKATYQIPFGSSVQFKSKMSNGYTYMIEYVYYKYVKV